MLGSFKLDVATVWSQPGIVAIFAQIKQKLYPAAAAKKNMLVQCLILEPFYN
jgi:hypothetical protein